MPSSCQICSACIHWVHYSDGSGKMGLGQSVLYHDLDFGGDGHIRRA